MQRESRVLAGAVAALFVPVTASALPAVTGGPCRGSVVQSDVVPVTTSPWTDSVTFDRFDPDLGTLREVRVTLTGGIDGSFQYESLDPVPSTATVNVNTNIQLQRPGGVSGISAVSPAFFTVLPLTAFDGVLDFSGTSGFSQVLSQTLAAAPFVASGASPDLALFTGVGGAGSPGTITLPVIANSAAQASGGANYAFSTLVQPSATVEVEYVYDACDCQAQSVPPMATNWSDALTFDLFDPDLGTLTGVVLELDARIQGSASVENPDASPVTILLEYQGLVALSGPGGGSPLLTASPLSTQTFNATGFDGTIDFAGTSGTTFAGLDVSLLATRLLTPADPEFAQFVGAAGAGPPGTITLPVDALGTSSGSAPAPLILQFMQTASADVRVCYEVSSPTGVSFCFGDGGDQMGCTSCPCANDASAGSGGGCLNSSGSGAELAASGNTSVSLPAGATSDLRFTLADAPAFALSVLTSGAALAPTNAASPCFGLGSGVIASDRDGLRCAVQNVLRHGNRQADVFGTVASASGPDRVWGGEASPTAGIAGQAGFAAGQTRYFQVTFRDNALFVCNTGLGTSQAVEIVFGP